jgi:hypothetical protein
MVCVMPSIPALEVLFRYQILLEIIIYSSLSKELTNGNNFDTKNDSRNPEDECMHGS